MNMSYCRFRNTRNDLEECVSELLYLYDIIEYDCDPETPDWKLTDIESVAALSMIDTFLDAMVTLEVIEDYDYEKAKKFLEKASL